MNASDQAVARKRSVRLVRRTARDRLPFAPYGLVPAAGLVLLFLFALVPFAVGEIQGSAERAARQALAGIGATWASVKASGQWVTLEGHPPSTTDAGEAKDAVLKATVPTLFGNFRPVTNVTELYTWGDKPAEAKPETPATPVSTPADPAVAPPVFQATPAPAETAAPVAPTPDPARPETTPAAAPPANGCNPALLNVLNTTRIEFETGRYLVSRNDTALLDSVAAAAQTCKGILRIEGYTDDAGNELANNQLSLQRAAEVRSALIRRGIAEDRLQVVGFGPDRPVATNNTEEGRGKNRRIELKLIPSAN
jgi:outer membrane protein OmpA-like peptidoglycan-associated protein